MKLELWLAALLVNMFGLLVLRLVTCQLVTDRWLIASDNCTDIFKIGMSTTEAIFAPTKWDLGVVSTTTGMANAYSVSDDGWALPINCMDKMASLRVESSTSWRLTLAIGAVIPSGASVAKVWNLRLSLKAHALIVCLNKFCKANVLGARMGDDKELLVIHSIFKKGTKDKGIPDVFRWDCKAHWPAWRADLWLQKRAIVDIGTGRRRNPE
jgi:hypothetical protein